jgi:hypothetical protein
MKNFRKSNKTAIVTLAFATLLAASCEKGDDYNSTPTPSINMQLFSAAGDSAAIATKLGEFRAAAGATANTTPGAIGGRREVNWDGVPANITNTDNFPFDFFGASDAALPAGRKRGLIYQNTGTSFRVDSTSFSEIEASYADQFKPFSKKKLFAYMGNNVSEISFKVPGTNTDAFVKSFAVIFTDVDAANSTSIEFFNGTKSLGVIKAGIAPQAFTLLGARFPDEKITKIKIVSGEVPLAAGVKDMSNGGTKDLVVMDDFIYSEPEAL